MRFFLAKYNGFYNVVDKKTGDVVFLLNKPIAEKMCYDLNKEDRIAIAISEKTIRVHRMSWAQHAQLTMLGFNVIFVKKERRYAEDN